MPATRDAGSLARRAVALLERTEAGTRPVRLLGVSLHGLVDHPHPPSPKPAGRNGDLPFDDGRRGAGRGQRKRGARTRSAAGITRMSIVSITPAGSPSTWTGEGGVQRIVAA